MATAAGSSSRNSRRSEDCHPEVVAMYLCKNCGETFSGTLHGAWTAKLHAEDFGHRLRRAQPASAESLHGLMLEPARA